MGKGISGHLAERVENKDQKEKGAESQRADCPNCGHPLLNLPWGIPRKELKEEGKKLVETRYQRYIRVCDNGACRLYRNTQGSFEGPCGRGS